MKKCHANTLLFIVLIFLFTSKSFGCGCGFERITQEDFDRYSLIFTGKLVKATACDEQGSQKFTFQIETIYKGQATRLVSGLNNCGGGCNFLFSEGQTWLVFSNPEYGYINDQHACNRSVMITSEENEFLIGKEDYVTKQEWEFEIDFLQSRITEDAKIVNFQFERLIPLLKKGIAFCIVILFFILCFWFKQWLLPYGILLGLINGYFLNLVVHLDLLQGLNKFGILGFTPIISGLLIASNIIYQFLVKELLNFKKSFILNYIIFLFMIITHGSIMYLNRPEILQFNAGFYDFCLTILGTGLLFSAFVALFFKKNRSKLKIKK
ncbi:hypothetical protein AAG747_12905 [Rapidithrix thailandica]|uniref:Uncharacterized protein n=1 Tax=Rapidithrix thailandica TaxID=413964 RepID=A0AAW9S4L7_9BACT